MRLRPSFLLATLFAVFLLSSCASPKPPAATIEPSPAAAPTATPAPTPFPTPTPLPTITPGPVPTALPSAVLGSGRSPATVYAGTEIRYEVSGLASLEKAEVSLLRPGGGSETIGNFRANQQGFVSYKRDSSKDEVGAWALLVKGEQGTQLRIAYTVKDLALPTLPVTEGATAFLVYQSREGAFYAAAGVRPGAVRRTADVMASTLQQVPIVLGIDLSGGINVYLLPNEASLRAEVLAAGATPAVSAEAGLSLYGFRRSGVYMDMSNSASTLPHIMAHEITHQVNARIEGDPAIPHWLEEGLAEYFAYQVAKQYEPEQERHWRRQVREIARRAIAGGTWVPLRDLADQSIWMKEPELRKGIQHYAQAYAAVDYIANTYGEEVLRPLFNALAKNPSQADEAMRQVLGIGYAELETRVRDSLSQMDAYEQEVQAMVFYGRFFFQIVDQQIALNQAWDRYMLERQRLTRNQRIVRMNEIAAQYGELASSLQSAAVPPALTEPNGVFAESLARLQIAIQQAAVYERDGSQRTLDQVNAGLQSGGYLFIAAQDRLAAILTGHAIGANNVHPTPTPVTSP